MSKNSSKKLYKQLLSWISNELHFGKGYKRVKDKKGNYIKVKNERIRERLQFTCESVKKGNGQV